MKKFILFLLLPFFSATPINCDGKLPSYSALDSDRHPIDHKLIDIMGVNKGKNRNNKGVFIEVGAHDGITQSNTYLLEHFFGWTGILVEPSKNAYENACKIRPKSLCFNCALGSFSENGTYIEGDFNGSTMSSINANRSGSKASCRVVVRSLQSILDEANISHVNFFSLDTEGYEYNILQGIDFSKTSFDYILIEIYNWDYDKIVSYLNQKGYKLFCCISNYNKKNNRRWDGTHNDYLFIRAQ